MYSDLWGLTGAQAAGYVGGKSQGLNPGEPLKLAGWSWREVRGMRGVAVKCLDIAQNPDCEGSVPAPH